MAAPSGRQFVSATDEKSTSTVLFHAALPVFPEFLYRSYLRPTSILNFGLAGSVCEAETNCHIGMLCGKVVFLAGIVTEVE